MACLSPGRIVLKLLGLMFPRDILSLKLCCFLLPRLVPKLESFYFKDVFELCCWILVSSFAFFCPPLMIAWLLYLVMLPLVLCTIVSLFVI